MTTVTLPGEYGYVILGCAISTFFVGQLMGGQVMKARKKYNVKYPNAYATPGHHDKADKFNNVQRGHMNMLEIFQSYLAMSLLGGVKHPLIVAGGSIAWNVGVYLYQLGYTEGAAARYKKGGFVKYIGLLASLGSSVSFAGSLLGWW
mmetsp:Transcript_7392/g.8346  ORF Transcript_7392/g.8346 Transcript_7392/m.8346 type:complete len:147 (+) Transcript_7392:27-467(+)|eukprot:CAMPEP_0205823544 /NCGR_PEP_ID=MMETSP0206-20130828/17177_1 /ASSEMBLY_ACC=CAM_ASM_000279 /TAXON_ID=36767 /ORGANISM="Euplotes focardii, Strain TN1" /LENGTH=146 /DNA_ID=CAMNT_0053120849 /DNA_START=27 /DNA_END=467 /DNA_ORIENTATION=-